MKVLLTIALALTSLSAFAMPAVGDIATFQIETNGMTVVRNIELTEFNAETKTFTQVESMEVQGQTQTTSTKVEAKKLMNDAMIGQMLAICEKNMGGKLETITVVAGTFDTCAVKDMNSDKVINFGKVPFGVVKIRSSEMNGELVHFVNGK